MQHLIKYVHQVRKSKHWQHTLYVMVVASMVLSLGQFSAPKSAEAADTGYKSPSANTANDGSSGDDWDNPTNAYSDGSGYASEQAQERHRYYNFSFGIPANATINGVVVKADAWSSDSSGCQLGVDLSWNGGSNWSSEKTQNLTGSEITYTLGSSSDMWGSHSWLDTDFSDSNFRVRVRDIDPGQSCNGNPRLDWLQVKVYYTNSHTIIATAGTGGSITPNGAVSVNDGANQSFNSAPSTGYILSTISIDGGGSVGRLNTYGFTNVTTDHTIYAAFEDGWSRPSSTANDNGVSGENNAYGSDNSYAVFNDSDDQVDYKNFSLSIPDGATINGIEVGVEGNRTSARNLGIQLSWNNGSNYTSDKNISSFTSKDATYLVGGPSDTWGRTWIVS